jgi:hypothetical protein
MMWFGSRRWSAAALPSSAIIVRAAAIPAVRYNHRTLGMITVQRRTLSSYPGRTESSSL